jgi:RNA polymerase sigma-70 factor, ECF subfamily
MAGELPSIVAGRAVGLDEVEPVPRPSWHFSPTAVSAAPLLTPIPDDDATLVARAAAGDERAFTALYRRHARYVAGVAFRLLGDEAELDDVVQETFVDAHDALASIRDGATVRAFLATITARKVARRIARRQRQRWLAGWLGLSAARSETPAVESEAFALYQALEGLSVDRRIPWTLHVVEGMTLPEVAAACGVSLATVKRRIADAGALLAKRGIGAVGGER